MIRIKQYSIFYFGLFVLITATAVGIGVFHASAANGSNVDSLKNKDVSVRLKSQNSPAVNLREGRDLPTVYDSRDYSSGQMSAGQNRPLALASADFDADGYPDLVTGYEGAAGGVLTLHKGNAEAFAPQSEESISLMESGRFPDPFLERAESYSIPAAPDFLVTGDFDRDGSLDVITAARGGEKIYLFSGMGKSGGFNAPQEIELAGRITALAGGEINASDNRADLLIGAENETGASLLIFEDAEKGVFAAPSKYHLPSAAISLELNRLDDDSLADAAILTNDGVYVMHGRDQNAGGKARRTGSNRLEQINLPFVPQALATGNFIWNRAGKTQLALLAEDGSIQIARRGELDERPFSIEETRTNRRQAAERNLRGGKENLPLWQPETSEDWTIAGGVNVAAPVNRQTAAAPILQKANLSGQNTDDILFLDSETRQIKILSTQEPEKSGGEAASFAGERAVYTLETDSTPAAVLPVKLNIFVRPGLVILQNGKTAPSVVDAVAVLTLTVDRTDDTNAAAAQVCSAAANDCSLRGAISKANGSAGADTINIPAGTYTLTLANSGGTNEDNNATGDLDINESVTINGTGGQAATIVQAGTTNANGIDKVFASNPFCTTVVSTSMTGLTVRFGRNTQTFNAADFSYTGGGLDWCNAGAGGNLTITDSTFDNNSATTGYGGGIDLDTAPGTSGTTNTVALTGVTISNNKSSVAGINGDFQPNGGGLAALGSPYTLNIINSTFTGNAAQTGDGGGIYIALAANSTNNGVFSLNNVTLSGNTAANVGGGIRFNGDGADSFTIQNSMVSGNTAGTVAGKLARGGGIFVTSNRTGSSTITKSTITNNVLSPNAATNEGGAGISTRDGAATVSYNRIVGNTGTTLGTGLNQKDTGTGAITRGTTNAAFNWWGCSTGPSAAPCDTAVLSSGLANSLTTAPYIVLRHTASPSTVVYGQTSTLTASFLTDSNNNAVAVANITALIGLPVTFNNPVRGTISAAQGVIQTNGTATATFTGNAIGTGSADAIVDNDVAAAGRTNRATLTINQAGTTTAVVSSQNPSVFNQSVTLTATVSVTAPGAGTPTGTVLFRDNGNAIAGCASAAVSGGQAQCATGALAVGSHTITVVYSGDTNFVTSTSPGLTQTVGKAATTVTINSHTPNPSGQNTNVTVAFSVTVNAPGAGTPTGTVTVSDGVDSCTASAAAGSCLIFLTTAGARTLTATYNGDANFNANTSAGVSQTVLPTTAAAVTVAGRVTAHGTGLGNAKVTLIGTSGAARTVLTNAFGKFTLTDVQTGAVYVVSVAAKKYTFAPQIVSVTDNVAGLTLTAQ